MGRSLRYAGGRAVGNGRVRPGSTPGAGTRVAAYASDTMSTTEESKTDGGRSPRAIAASHISTDGTQLWYDTEREQAVVIEKADGWNDIGNNNYRCYTWHVRCLRCYVASVECKFDKITQGEKLRNVESGRFEAISEEGADERLNVAVEKNRKWSAVHTPHIPFSGPGGVNVYIDDERAPQVRRREAGSVTVADEHFHENVFVTVEYDENGIHAVDVEFPETTEEPVRAQTGSETYTICDLVEHEPGGMRRYCPDGETKIELRHDTDCDEWHGDEDERMGESNS